MSRAGAADPEDFGNGNGNGEGDGEDARVAFNEGPLPSGNLEDPEDDG
jgi:hypothetical protein